MMPTKSLLCFSTLVSITACAGPMGPPLGLGPGLDSLVGLAFVAFVVAISYRAFRRLLASRRQSSGNPNPANIVKERYARGESTGNSTKA